MNIKKLFEKKKYQKMLDYFLKNSFSVNNVEMYYLGLALFELGYREKSLELLTDIIPKLNYLDCSRGLCYLGLLYFSFGAYKLSCHWLKSAVEAKGDFSNAAQKWLMLLHFTDENPPLYSYENNYMRFHFINNINIFERDNFMDRYTEAYLNIISFFRTKLDKKIDVYIYDSHKDVIGGNLSYANSPLSTIHTYLYDECGHELTHVIVYYIEGGVKEKKPFIDEGTAECFNKVKYNYNFKNFNKDIDLFDLWNNFKLFDKAYGMAIAKKFCEELILRGGREKFIELLHEQTIISAEKIYGHMLYEIKWQIEADVHRGCFNKWQM